ncbi:Putative ribonuclease H protein At1g65750 [Linum perenne]
MEILSAILSKLQEADLVSSFFINERARSGQVNHILYTDDSLIFCDADVSQVRFLLAGLICFECVTGLKINIFKSSLFAVGEVDNADVLADTFGCELASLPTSYLGLPLGERVSNSQMWTPVIERVERRLGNWKASMLSYGARLVLIKSVLASLPTYHLSLFKAPSRVIGTIEKIQRRFLWEGTADHKSFHWVDWSYVKCPIAKGGLGILDIKTYNEALLGKWLWRYATEKRAWWRTLIVQKYGIGSSDWLPSSDFGSSSLSVWIRISQFGSSFWRFASIDPGEGIVPFGVIFGFWGRDFRIATRGFWQPMLNLRVAAFFTIFLLTGAGGVFRYVSLFVAGQTWSFRVCLLIWTPFQSLSLLRDPTLSSGPMERINFSRSLRFGTCLLLIASPALVLQI